MTDDQLIFIVSQPRAGSTLLQSIISNNEKVNTSSETWILLNFISFFRPELINASYNQYWAKDAITAYISRYPTTDFESLIKEMLLRFYEPMLSSKYVYVLDKTPRYYEILNDIINIFPKAKIILIKRDPIEVVKSIITTLGLTNILSLSKYFRDIMVAPYMINDFCKKQKGKKNIYTLRYEDLITNPDFEIKRIYGWLNIAYDDKVLKFKHNEKIKGVFGDPYLNNSDRDKISLKTKPKLNYTFNKFMQGYAYFLSNEFLNEYGGYYYENARRTKVFDLFKNIEDKYKFENRYGVKKEIMFKLLRWF